MQIILKAKNIQIILAKKNRDYSWLAERTGVSTSYVYKIMRGEHSPSGIIRQRIQKAFNNECWDNLFAIIEGTGASGGFMTATVGMVTERYEK
jgi:transcriptional regulator with XRE-family HTH domain